MRGLVDVLKGVIIGVANVVPGVSGGTLAISMGIYKTLIDALNGFFKAPLKSIKIVWKYAVGMVFGVLLSVFLISYLFELVPVVSSMLFIGLILGAMPETITKLNKPNLRDILVIIIVGILVVLFAVIGHGTESMTFDVNIITMLVLGIVIAITIVVPGISGSAVLMALGCYTYILTMIKETIKCLITFKFLNAFNTGKMLIFLSIGVVIGIFLTAKVIQKLIRKYPNSVGWGIATLMGTTPFLVMFQLNFRNITVVETILSIFMLIVGCMLAQKLSKKKE